MRVKTPSNRDAVIRALFAVGAEGVQELEDEIVTHIRAIDERLTTAAVRRADAIATLEFELTPAVDWSAGWRSQITAHRLNRLVVTPPWMAEQFAESERIVIDPGMAFGTGEHETTRGILRLMQDIIRPGDAVADVGTGSGVLAIAAAKLGARRVVAIEVDPDAIGNAEDNVARNRLGERVTVLEGDAAALLPLVAPVRVILVNIVSSVVLELMPAVASALTADGVAIVGGILRDERSVMESALGGAWRIVGSDEEGAWWSAAIARR